MLVLNSSDAIAAKLGEWPIDAEGELSSSAMMIAGLHVLEVLRQARGLPSPEAARGIFPPIEA
jgi:hypothetical protein